MKLVLDKDHCYLDSSYNLKYLILKFVGNVEITDLTPENFFISNKEGRLLIMNYKKPNIHIEELFSYIGSLNIRHGFAVMEDGSKKRIPIVNRKFKNNIEMLAMTIETMTMAVEEYNNTFFRSRRKGVHLDKESINDISSKKIFYYENNDEYQGLVHLHLNGKNALKYFVGPECENNCIKLNFKKTDKIIKNKQPKLRKPYELSRHK
tara:strand:- start:20116 stop:20736 length:621 start_codon:yes stop_codon:yes gene_type:complete